MPGDWGERTHVSQMLAASPVTGPWRHTLTDWAFCLPPLWGHFQANLLMGDQNQLTAVAEGEPRDQQPRRGVQGEADAMAIVFQPPGCGGLGGANPATAASWHKINRRGTDTWAFGELLSFNFSFSQCISLLLSKHKVFWRNGCVAPWHPAADQDRKAQTGSRDCSCCFWELRPLKPPSGRQSCMPPVCLFWTPAECIKSVSLTPSAGRCILRFWLWVWQLWLLPGRYTLNSASQLVTSLWYYLRNYI